MITYTSRWMTRGEVWFDHEPGSGNLDFILYNQRTKPLPHTRSREFYTLVLDLRASPQELLAQMDKTTVYKIKRARERDKIICESCDTSDPSVLRAFADYYDPFAKQRGWTLMDRHWLTKTAEAGALDLTRARSPEGEILVYHTLIRTKTRVRGLHSPSFFRDNSDSATRSYVGRANRFLHWHSMMRFKEEGVSIYDFGGWYTGKVDEGRLRINEFKRGFGGEIVCNYNCEQVLTLKGRLLLAAARSLRRLSSGTVDLVAANENVGQQN
jgi:hypothetical protein